MSSKLDSIDHTHGVMFHHFHSDFHPVEQGSLPGEKFEELLDWLTDKYSLLSATEYLRKLKNSSLRASDICLTFDDALKCQYDVAVPILKKRNIEAFFFVYSSPFLGYLDSLEIYRYFRSTNFLSIDDFYSEFFESVKTVFSIEYFEAKDVYDEVEYLTLFPFYTKNDKWFRYLLDVTLGSDRYTEIMKLILDRHKFDTSDLAGKLWMDNSNLISLANDGHLIGLHSFSHPMMMHLLDKETQAEEYSKNFEHLKSVLGISPKAMSHPSGSYNDATLRILKSMNIEIGFRSSFGVKEIKSNLEIPREDHSNAVKAMEKEAETSSR